MGLDPPTSCWERSRPASLHALGISQSGAQWEIKVWGEHWLMGREGAQAGSCRVSLQGRLSALFQVPGVLGSLPSQILSLGACPWTEKVPGHLWIPGAGKGGRSKGRHPNKGI